MTTSLFEFFQIFEQVLHRWRSKEREDNYKNRMEKPPEVRNAHPLVRQAAEVYTLNLFHDFLYEFETAMKSYIKADRHARHCLFYLVSTDSEFKDVSRVLCHLQLEKFQCNCSGFRETKLLCFHILRVMHFHNVFVIPDKYIDARWRKDAKLDSYLGVRTEPQQADQRLDEGRY